MTADRRTSRPLIPPRTALWLASAAAPVGLLVLVVTLWYGDALEPTIPGLDQSGPVTNYGQSIAELATHAAGVLTVGWLLMTVVFVPGAPVRKGARAAKRAAATAEGATTPPPVTLSAVGSRALRAASLSAIVWAVAALVCAVFSFATLVGRPVTDVLYGSAIVGYFVDIGEGRALLATVVIAAALSVAAHLPRTPWQAGPLLLLALVGLTPTIFTGHAAAADNHALAVFGLGVHLVGAGTWIGGLIVLIVAGRRLGGLLPRVVSRFSALALWCFIAVGASGLVSAYVRLEGIDLTSNYGQLVAAKAGALAILGALGLWHRKASIPALRTQRRGRTFVRIAVVEGVVMVATVALAVGLSRTPTPLLDTPLESREAYLLGFPIPGPPSLGAYALDWWIDPLFALLVAAGAVLYGIGLARVRRAGVAWPVSRTVAWYAGLAAALVLTSSGLAKYSMIMFSAYVVQHLLIGTVVPLALVLGAPVTLALRALRTDEVVGASPRDLVLALVRGRSVRLVAHPVVSFPLVGMALYGFYLTGLFETTLVDHAVHSLTLAAALLAGVLLLWPILGGPWSPHQFDMTVRFAVLLGLIPLHAFFGLAFATSQGVFVEHWFALFKLPWRPSPLDDQQFGGVLAWWTGLAATLLSLGALARLWVRGSAGTAPAAVADTGSDGEPEGGGDSAAGGAPDGPEGGEPAGATHGPAAVDTGTGTR